MLFRPRRNSLSSYHPKSSSGYGKSLPERPNSAPVANNLSNNGGTTHVEQQLRIVRRNRVRQGTERPHTVSGVALTSSPPVVLTTATVPPCASYPTFYLSHLTSHEQHMVEELVSEVTDAIAFPNARKR